MKYGITAKAITSGNPMSNAVLESIHQVLGNLLQNITISKQTYVEKNELWTGILAAATFSILSTIDRQKFIVWAY